MQPDRPIPELLAPAGDWECVRAAVENGADAIYFGLDCGFNARDRAKNFAPSDLPDLVEYVHQRGVKAYVTLNTLAFPGELSRVEQVVREIAASGVDAVLVQDLGVARLVRAVCPSLELHASTQMTLTSAECIRVADELGIQRVVLARELSIDEIRKIHSQTAMPLEVFVHGALCVAYSGQCLTSESLGGRSANRGQCAQACRLAYDLICDGQDVDLDRVRYLLSPQDLAAYELTPELIEAGVCSLKIEGRLKTPEYVANITRHYREAIDQAVSGSAVNFSPRQVQEMELSFSRGFSPGWLQGCDHKMLVPGLSSAKRGVLLGKVVRLQKDRVSVELACPVARGDGVVFEGNREENAEQGGRIFHVYVDGRQQDHPVDHGIVELTFDRQRLDVTELAVGQQVWKTDDPQLTKRLRSSYTQHDAVRRVALHFHVVAIAGKPLHVRGRTQTGLTCEATSAEPLPVAIRHPLTTEVLQKQLGRLGGTVYELAGLDAEINGNPMVPLSVLGQCRRELISQLASSSATPTRELAPEPALARLDRPYESANETLPEPRLRVLCRSLPQLECVLQQGVAEVYVDFQDIREYADAVPLAQQYAANIFLATPRIQKPGEVGIFRALMRHGADGMLVRNLAGLDFFLDQQVPLVADFSLNVSNQLTAQFLMDRGAGRLTASYDLNRDQLLELVEAVPTHWLEVVIHQHMPMFHMEHCVFCAVLSPGTNKTNCGRPCDFHEVKLRDRVGKEHLLTADVGCRNTLFNATPQSAAEIVPTLLAKGIRDFRIEVLEDEGPQISRILNLYRDLFAGRITGKEVWKSLQASNRVGVTRGTLDERRNPLAIL
ncbi:MAG TPA: peptidase U32 [Planctomycetaceae bacterium]|nr:peptidase U32 [Blastopirellula sp.]HAY82396.1 peptidase U32 [Planctomycetaceae bacterium]